MWCEGVYDMCVSVYLVTERMDEMFYSKTIFEYSLTLQVNE